MFKGTIGGLRIWTYLTLVLLSMAISMSTLVPTKQTAVLALKPAINDSSCKVSTG